MSLNPVASSNHHQVNSENIGIGLVVFGIIVIAIALWNYNRIFWQIERGAYQPNRLIVWITSIVVVILGILSLTVMVRQKPVFDRHKSKLEILFPKNNAKLICRR